MILMLIKLHLENVYSIQVADIIFTKGRYAYKKDMVYNEAIVSPVAIYGFNGSGKSSIFKSMAFLASFWREGNNQPLEQNYLLEQLAKKKLVDNPYLVSKFGLTFQIGKNIYEYNLSLANNEVLKEDLTQNGLKLFERLGNKYMIYGFYENLGETKAHNKSILTEIGDKFLEVTDYFHSFSIILDKRINSQTSILDNKNIYDIMLKYQEQINEILLTIPGACTYKIIKQQFNYFLEYDNLILPIEKMSRGQFNLNMIISLILASPRDSMFFIDDIDANLHPFALEKIITLAKERDIQLVLSSHNTHLMQFLRPDQIYFVSFDGKSSLYKRLSDFKDSIREINNIEKMYLADAFKG